MFCQLRLVISTCNSRGTKMHDADGRHRSRTRRVTSWARVTKITDGLESATAAAAETAAARTAPKPRASAAPWCRRHRGRGRGRHDAEIVREHRWTERAHAAGTAVPRRRLRVDAVERLRPVILHAERHRVRQVLLEHLRCLDHPLEAIAFHPREELAEPKHFLQ